MCSLGGRVLLILTLLNVACGYKILVFFPYPGKSHNILGNGFVRHFVDAGHNVTFVTAIPIKNPAPNLRQIDVSSNFQKFSLTDSLNIKKVIDNQVNLKDFATMYNLLHDVGHLGVMHENVQKFLMDTSESFDVAIIEWIYDELHAGVASVFDCPFIWSSPMDPDMTVMPLIDDIPNPAYIPDHFSSMDPPFTFLERVTELMRVINLHRIRWNMADIVNTHWQEAYGPAMAVRGRHLPSIYDVRYNSSLMFGNSHVSSCLPVSLPQNYVAIGGYHIDSNVAPLPEHLQKIMDSAAHGVIYFSLGTMMKGKTLPAELRTGFLNVFSELKQTVIWKYEEKLTDLPQNVHIVEWAPQHSILAHPKTVLFISHGGLLSTTETIHFGVPVIGIPLFADQFINMKRAAVKGFGKLVKIGYDADVQLKEAIQDVLQNPSYRQRINDISFIYHHRPASPGAELVHWTEHVIKTRGAPHLRSPGFMVPWYQKMYLDLIGLILVLIVGLVKIVKIGFSRYKVNLKMKLN